VDVLGGLIDAPRFDATATGFDENELRDLVLRPAVTPKGLHTKPRGQSRPALLSTDDATPKGSNITTVTPKGSNITARGQRRSRATPGEGARAQDEP
jgi:hypothetical protein